MLDREAAESWLSYAMRDLAAARLLTADDMGEIVLYHSQQAAEKAVKGFLALHRREIEKIHSIPRLLLSADEIEPGFAAWTTQGAKLTNWGYDYRYPDDGIISVPEPEVVSDGLSYAAEILAFVRAKIDAAEDA